MKLDNLNLVELNAQEVKVIDGGHHGVALANADWNGFWHNVGDFFHGFYDGISGKK